jgi:hypothetical protein
MIPFKLNPDVKLGDLLTSVSVLLGALALMTTWVRDRSLRRKEYADRVRGAAVQTIAALRRRHVLACRLFDEVEPRITDADVKLVKTRNSTAVRDQFWQDIVVSRTLLLKEMFQENFEDAYVSLLAYDPTVQELSLTALDTLDKLDFYSYHQFKEQTQDAIMSYEWCEPPPESNELGNQLREILGNLQTQTSSQMQEIVNDRQQKLFRLANASDRQIIKRKISFD